MASKSTGWLFIHCVKIELEFRNVGLCGRRKTRELREKPSEQGQELTTNSTQICINSGIQTQATSVGGECFHRCATLSQHMIQSDVVIHKQNMKI